MRLESEAKIHPRNSAVDRASPSLSPAPPKDKSAQTQALLWHVLEIFPKTSTLWVGEGKPAGPFETTKESRRARHESFPGTWLLP